MDRKKNAKHCFSAAIISKYVPIEKKINSENAGLTEYLLQSFTTEYVLKNAGKKK